MTIRVSPKVVVFFVIVVLAGVAITGSVAADTTVYGLELEEAAVLFGNGLPEHDNQPFTDDQIDEIDSGDWLSSDELFSDLSIKWDEPIELHQTWNENNFADELEAERPTDESIAPDSADVTDSDYIKHAHATIYSVDPLTTVHRENRSENYISSTGEVNSNLDFLVEVPEDKNTESSASQFVSSESQVSIPRGTAQSVDFSFEKAEVTQYDFLVDGSIEDDATPLLSDYPGTNDKNTHTSSYTFEFEDVDGEPTLQVEAVIESRIEATIEYEYETTNSEGETVTRTGTTTDTINDDVTVSDEIETVVEDLDGTEIEIFELPDGDTVSIVDTPTQYSRFEVGGETAPDGFWAGVFSDREDIPPDEIQTDWTFITTRDTGWDQATKAVESGGETDTEVINTSEIPIQRHVYPTGHGPRSNETDDDDVAFPHSVEDLDEPTKSAVDLPSGVAAHQTGNYSDQTSLRTHHLRSVTDEDFEIYGVVEDDPHLIPADEIETREVEEGNLSVEVESMNMSRDRPTEVTITLLSEDTNDPVDMTQAGGEVVITDHPDQRVDLGDDGTATVRTNATGLIQAEYHPPEWTESQQPVTEASDIDRTFDLPDRDTAIGWIVDMTIRLVPVFLALYVITAFREMFVIQNSGGGAKRR